jgi:hypothetical protein
VDRGGLHSSRAARNAPPPSIRRGRRAAERINAGAGRLAAAADHGPDADGAVGVAGVEGVAVGRPAQGEAANLQPPAS